MKYAPKKVFIKENKNYIEITNEEHERRKATDEQYAKRRFIPLQSYLLEVDEVFYTDHYREVERNKYLRLLDRKKKLLSIDAFDTEDDNGIDYIADEDENVEKQVTDKLMAEHIRHVVSLLPSDEQELINAIYFEGCTEREYAKKKGVNQFAIHKKKHRILEKLKKILGNS